MNLLTWKKHFQTEIANNNQNKYTFTVVTAKPLLLLATLFYSHEINGGLTRNLPDGLSLQDEALTTNIFLMGLLICSCTTSIISIYFCTAAKLSCAHSRFKYSHYSAANTLSL